MDMARKFLRMGWTRARRYANHPGGRKYRPGTREELPRTEDATKAEAAQIFRALHTKALKNRTYQRLLREHARSTATSPPAHFAPQNIGLGRLPASQPV
jgi:hypothetical protein